ncbi:MAG: NAD(P)/FAD-dependent oxidoreductase, partial [Muribaculaceae bacterium]|nr:NAD(P)/FAD-dependent oxidoreductase [Muribaculaceae bacterium]
MARLMRSAEIIIIGGGPGGYEVAAELAANGHKVILIERDRLGGTCLNRGCIPTKCLCASASAAMTVASAADFGVDVSSFSVDYGKAVERANGVINQLRDGIDAMLRDVEVIKGEASLKPDKIVVVNGEEISAERIIIATGSRPAVLDIPGAKFAVTSDEFLSLTEIPQRVAIIGGGVIGLEFASILAAFGREVTVIEFCKEVLPPFDTEIAKRLRTALTRRGIKFMTSTKVIAIEKGLRIIYEGKRGKDSLECDLAVMAVGRRPVLPDGIKEAGIELTERGFIKVDELMETSVRGIYAVGDVNGLCMLAHAASAQARRAIGSDVNLDVIPSAVFTQPEAAMVGMTEEQAKAKDYE